MFKIHQEDLKILINDLAAEINENAHRKGFYDGPFNVGEKVALIHSELSEFLEVMRKPISTIRDEHCPEFFNEEIELADVIIRVLDLAFEIKLNIEGAIIAKHEYNKTRPYKHGKAF